jgi:hypothetical protein
MKTLSGCTGRACLVEGSLPLIGPALAFALMMVAVVGTAASTMLG